MERINDKITRYELICAFQEDPLPWIAHPKQPLPNVWFTVPQWWWFERVDIELFERLHHREIVFQGHPFIQQGGSQSNSECFLLEIRPSGKIDHLTQEIDPSKKLFSYGLARKHGTFTPIDVRDT